MPGNDKSMRIRLLIAAVLSLLVSVTEGSLYVFAKIHLKEILLKGSVPVLFGLGSVTESAALANPHLTVTVVCALLSAACFVGAHMVRKKSCKKPEEE